MSQKTLLVCDMYSDRASAHSAWGRRHYSDYLCVTCTQTEHRHTVLESEDITCVWHVLRQSISTYFHLGLCELCVQAELNQKHKSKISFRVSRFDLAITLASRVTLVQFCFSSPSSSKIVVCGHCFETLPLPINGTLKRHLSLPILISNLMPGSFWWQQCNIRYCLISVRTSTSSEITRR